VIKFNFLQELVPYFKEKLGALARTHGEKLLRTPHNPISIGMQIFVLRFFSIFSGITLSTFPDKTCSYLGSMLFSRRVSGPRCSLHVGVIVGHFCIELGLLPVE